MILARVSMYGALHILAVSQGGFEPRHYLVSEAPYGQGGAMKTLDLFGEAALNKYLTDYGLDPDDVRCACKSLREERRRSVPNVLIH